MEYAPAATPAERSDHYRRFGYQSDISLTSLMVRNRDELGHLPAVFDGDIELSWRQLVDTASRFGGFLHARGVGAGDVVVWQLPNWWESLVVAYGIWAVGAISSPVVPIYREFELRNVIGAVSPRCVVAAKSFRDRAHVDMIAAACADVGCEPAVQVVLRGSAPGWTAFEDAVTAAPFVAGNIDVDAPALVGWTSGTTSGAKGVVHSTRSFLSSPLRSTRLNSVGWNERSYMPAPIAHATGLLSAIAVPAFAGCSTVIRDSWDAERMIDDIARYGVTFSAGAAVFMRDVLNALAARGMTRMPLAAGYPCGGSTIPTILAEECDDAGMLPARSWGMTECPSVSASSPRLNSRAIRTSTDGLIAPGCAVRVVGDDGTELPIGEAGEMLARGPQRALGYLDPAHTKDSFDDDGWFRTGDVGFVDARGTVTVTGRVKEIINRGGEKLSSREIEDALTGHPAVREAAVIPAPHPRLGEQPAAFVLARSGTTPQELPAYLRSTGMAPQKIPQVWRFVDDLPRTASGKVRKSELQSELEAERPGEGVPPEA
ncbi:MAG TPA: AMP-binding protein [Acidimicrobiales bacterium]|nr:AMP-binding protein [Acidimicrobiales bacterium]